MSKQTYNYFLKDGRRHASYDKRAMNSSTKMIINHEKIFQSLATPYIVFAVDDPTFTIIEENQAHADMSMLKREDVIGKSALEAFPDTSKEADKNANTQFIKSIRKVIRTGKSNAMPDLHYDLKDSNGQLVPKYWSVIQHPVMDDDGAVTAVYQVAEDITDKVLSQQRLELTQYQLSQALSRGFIGTWVWDIASETVVGDANLADVFGLEAEKTKAGVPLKDFIDAIHPDDRARSHQLIMGAVKDCSVYENEFRTINNEGDVRWVVARGQVETDEHNQPVRFPGVTIDITERKNNENRLGFLTKASAQFAATLDYKKTLSNIAAMVVPDMADWCTIDLLDDNGQLQQVTVAHKDPKKIAWAKQLREEQGAPDMEEPSGVPKVIRTGEPEYYPDIPDEMLVASAKSKEELKLLRSLGFKSVMIVPLKINDKAIGAITFITTESRVHYKPADLEVAKSLANRAAMAVENANLYQAAQHEIKERKRLQHQMETMNERLELRVRERTKQLVETNDGLEKEIRKRRKAERDLQKYTKDLARSNQELQDFAYVASHDLQEPLRKIQAFGDLLDSEYKDTLKDGAEYLTRMRSAASRMSVLIEDLLSFSRVTTKDQPNIPVDLNTTIEDVVGDLETSVTANEGKITIEKLPVVWADPTHMRQLFQNLIGNALKFHKDDEAPDITISAKPREKKDTNYEICIIDNGIGFDEKYLDRIFSVFQRLHSRDSPYGGTGIGLAVCRRIAERYGGTIEATSKVGVGSTFTFKIPINHKEQPHDRA
ncbi:MAG TPA: ATP-binding protein [Candidatus Saccharimonadales bacterium]|nr:ATP-binding protein [Candidatus Saccharimonadales bacterium]